MIKGYANFRCPLLGINLFIILRLAYWQWHIISGGKEDFKIDSDGVNLSSIKLFPL